MNTKNRTSNAQSNVSAMRINLSYWKGFAKRISIPIVALVVIHISARVLNGLHAISFGYDFTDGFSLTEYAYVSGGIMYLIMLHAMAMGMIILLILVPFGLYQGIKWLIKG